MLDWTPILISEMHTSLEMQVNITDNLCIKIYQFIYAKILSEPNLDSKIFEFEI